MEHVFEIIFDFIVSGAVEGVFERKVPVVIRIIFAAILLTIYLGFSGLLIAAGIRENEKALLILGIIIFLFFGGAAIYKFLEYRRKDSKE